MGGSNISKDSNDLLVVFTGIGEKCSAACQALQLAVALMGAVSPKPAISGVGVGGTFPAGIWGIG